MRHKIFVAAMLFIMLFHLNTYGLSSRQGDIIPLNALPVVQYSGNSDLTGQYLQLAAVNTGRDYQILDTDYNGTLNTVSDEYHDENISELIYNQPFEYIIEENNREINAPTAMIALTFDDGPGQNTELILDILEKHNIKATFCVIGSRISTNENIFMRTFESGHEIIGHSWSHPNYTLLSRAEIIRQISYTNDEIYRLTGSVPSFHRPPYGAVNYTVQSASRELDLAILNWSVDPRDWENSATADGIFDHIMDRVFDGSILLFHDIHDVTVAAIEKIVPELIKRGYQLVTVSELMSHSENPPVAGEIYRRR